MNISFSKLGQHGRLANQLFQVAATLGMAQRGTMQAQTRYGLVMQTCEAAFPDWQYEKYFDMQLTHGCAWGPVVKEEHFHHYDWQLKESCDLLGYMQSEKYFPDYNPFVFKQEFIDLVLTKLPIELRGPTENILIHIRRGDYVGNQHYYQLPITYYIDALERFFPGWYDTKNLIIISDDIPYCRIHFGCLTNVFFADDFDEIESIALASLCDNYILSNSSFSWWGAWLGEKTWPRSRKRIIHPGHLFAGPSLGGNDTKDFWPARWTEFKQEAYKLPLKDMTFTVPVFFDHKDRKQNLDLSVCMLQTAFDTNIIIGEQGSHTFGYMEQWAQYRWFAYKFFHRTKMLNQMAEMAETPYIANWDCDVVIPPLQIYMAVVKLRMAAADMVFPYDGRFARLPRTPWFPALQKALDIGVVKDTAPKGKRGKDVPESSVGGAVFFNKQKFIEGGMENENMISFGPEDCERNDRFTALGYKVGRVGGCLYHIDHFIGPNSSKGNPYFRANHREFDKVRSMQPSELRAYVNTWAWRPGGVMPEEVATVLAEVCQWAERMTGQHYQIVIMNGGGPPPITKMKLTEVSLLPDGSHGVGFYYE